MIVFVKSCTQKFKPQIPALWLQKIFINLEKNCSRKWWANKPFKNMEKRYYFWQRVKERTDFERN
jgi:hypothetical protein